MKGTHQERHNGGGVAGGYARRLLQVCTVLAAMVIGLALVWRGKPQSHFDMLSYLDAQVAHQEDDKDVRCWSSFCKLQMFLTGAEIKEEAIAVRIDRHMQLIQSIWDEARFQVPDDSMISSDAVSSVLAHRFPYEHAASGATFQLLDEEVAILVPTEAIRDYSDTVEPWRLLQTWASRHTDDTGRLTLRPPFDEQALHVLSSFLRTYDLAILQRARHIAQSNKSPYIDSEAMSEAFRLDTLLQR